MSTTYAAVSLDAVLFYHGTDAVFSTFSLDFAARPDRCVNGHLGIWLAKDRELARKFGRLCLTVEVASVKALSLVIDDLSHIHQRALKATCDAAFYQECRQGFIADGYDFIHVIEGDGLSYMGIGLVPSNLRIITSEEQ